MGRFKASFGGFHGNLKEIKSKYLSKATVSTAASKGEGTAKGTIDVAATASHTPEELRSGALEDAASISELPSTSQAPWLATPAFVAKVTEATATIKELKEVRDPAGEPTTAAQAPNVPAPSSDSAVPDVSGEAKVAKLSDSPPSRTADVPHATTSVAASVPDAQPLSSSADTGEPSSTAVDVGAAEPSANVAQERREQDLLLRLPSEQLDDPDPKAWGRPAFRKSHFVRVEPGTYAVPYKKKPIVKDQYVDLHAYTKGKIHQIQREELTKDPREFVYDEGKVMYRVWIPAKLHQTVEFIFAREDQMTAFIECAHCGAYATESCSGCKKVQYCSLACQNEDWKAHKSKCGSKGTGPKGRLPPPLGDRVAADEDGAGATPEIELPRLKSLPRRKFKRDGRVVIVNAYKPRREETPAGVAVIMPHCLRPMTDTDEEEPLPDSRSARAVRKANLMLRRMIYRNRAPEESKDSEGSMDDAAVDAATGKLADDNRTGTAAAEGDDHEPDSDKNPRANGGESTAGAEGAADEGTGKGSHLSADGEPQEGAEEGTADTDAGEEGPGAATGEVHEAADETTADVAEVAVDEEKGDGVREERPAKSHPQTQSLQVAKVSELAVVPEETTDADLEGAPSRSASLVPEKSLNTVLGELARMLPSLGRGSKQVYMETVHPGGDTARVIAQSLSRGSSSASPMSNGSPMSGADSLVEGEKPPRRQSRHQPSSPISIPELPRIRVRTDQPPPPQVKPSGRPENFPVQKDAQPWPLVSQAKLDKSPTKKRGTPKTGMQRSKSGSSRGSPHSEALPEVFKRLTAQVPGLGVCSLKEGGSSPTKRAGKPSGSPLKKNQTALGRKTYSMTAVGIGL